MTGCRKPTLLGGTNAATADLARITLSVRKCRHSIHPRFSAESTAQASPAEATRPPPWLQTGTEVLAGGLLPTRMSGAGINAQ
jgi:hypothetical protein